MSGPFSFLTEDQVDQLAETGADEALYPRIRLITISDGENLSFPKASFPFLRVSKCICNLGNCSSQLQQHICFCFCRLTIYQSCQL